MSLYFYNVIPVYLLAFRFEVIGTKGNCVDYEFFVSDKINHLDLAVIAGKEGARFKTAEIREP